MNAATARRLCSGLALAALILAGAEALLRLAGFRFSYWYIESPIYEPAKDGVHVRTARMFTDAVPYGFPFCYDQSFAARKPSGVLRIAFAGESSVRNLGGAEDLADLLSRKLGRPVEILNFGFGGCGSERVLLAVKECLAYDPDALVVYAGHNEFVSFSNPATRVDSRGRPRRRRALPDVRLLQLVAKASLAAHKPDRARLQGMLRTYGEADKGGFYSAFRSNLAGMVSAARARHVPVLLCTLAYNLQDLTLLPALAAEAEAAEDATLQQLQAALWLRPGDIALERAYGRKLAEAGDAAGAAHHLEQALLLDPRPNRADARINGIIREVAQQDGAAVADVHDAVARAAPQGLPGRELFVDNCHLNERGRKILVHTVAEALAPLLSGGG